MKPTKEHIFEKCLNKYEAHSDWPRGVFARDYVNIVGVSVKRGPDTWGLRMLMSYGGWENEERKMRVGKRSVIKTSNRNKRI